MPSLRCACLSSAVNDLGDCTVSVSHPDRGHTDHDLIAVVAGLDLVQWPSTLERVLEAGVEDAVFVPGLGAVVDAAFVRGQQA